MGNKKNRGQAVAIAAKIGLFLVLAGMLITNMGAGNCGDGFNLCGFGSTCNSNPPPPPPSTPSDTSVTVSFLASLDGRDWQGPLTFTVNGSTHDSVLYEMQGETSQTMTVTHVSGGPPRASLSSLSYGSQESQHREESPTITFTLGDESCFVLFEFQSTAADIDITPPSPDYQLCSAAVTALLDGNPWEGSINYFIQGPVSVLGTSVPRSYDDLQPGNYTINYLSGGPPEAVFAGITPAENQDLAEGDQASFTLNFQSGSTNNNTLSVGATLDGSPWTGNVTYSLTGPESASGFSVPSEFTGLTPGQYSLSYQSGGPEGAVLSRISPDASQDVSSSGDVYFVLEFISTGKIIVDGLIYDDPWSGQCKYNISGPVKLTGTTLPQTFENVPAGEYTLTYVSGAPGNGVFYSVTPKTQSLSAGGTADFNIRFVFPAVYQPPVVSVPPSPTVTSISPSSGPADGGTIVTITGTSFTGTNAVSFGGTAAGYTVNSDTQITAVSPAHAAGPAQVTVTTPGGTSVEAVNFTYIVPTADLSVTAIADNYTPVGTGYFNYIITITNNGPDTATGIRLKFQPSLVSFVSSTTTQGTYDSDSSSANAWIWNAGTIVSGSSATLTVYVGISGFWPSGTVITNTAEIIAASTYDPDSTPDNGDPAEDDQASVTVIVSDG